MFLYSPVVVFCFLVLPQAAHSQQQPYNDWDSAYKAAEELVSSWTFEQIANVTVRNGQAPGYLPFTATDGPHGIAGSRGASGWTNPQSLAMSWDLSLVETEYAFMAREFRGKGISVLLGPISGPLGRSPYGGRQYETFGADPYLNGKMFGLAIKSIQEQQIVACGKHFIVNEQETNRTDQGNRPDFRTNSIVDDRTMHELYLWPWYDGVANGMGSAMCVMNRVNGEIGCENGHLMNELLRDQLGFNGFLVPDVTAPINFTKGTLGGLDWNSGHSLSTLLDEIQSGAIPEDLIIEQATRVVATMLNFALPQADFPTGIEAERAVVREDGSREFIRKAGAESITLLKNVNGTLPLQEAGQLFGIFGVNAGNLDAGPVSVLNALDYFGETWPSHLASGGGGSSAPNPYIISPLDALTQRISDGAEFDITYILADNYTLSPPPMSNPNFPLRWQDPSIIGYASKSDTCLVFLNAYSKEGADRLTLRDETGDELVRNVADHCEETVVIISAAGLRLVDAWIEHPNVTAVLISGPLGQESGNSIVDVLFGDVNPSGKLPYTIAKDESDYNGQICDCCECEYSEGLYIDYRHFDEAEIEPRYEFGFGLSYTEFAYSGLSAARVGNHTKCSLHAVSNGRVQQGGPADIYHDLMTITASVTNTGDVAGAEVAQLYLQLPEAAKAPFKQLRGFTKVFLEPGEAKSIEFVLQRRDLSVWDVDEQAWRMHGGTYTAYLSKSSRDVQDEISFELITH